MRRSTRNKNADAATDDYARPLLTSESLVSILTTTTDDASISDRKSPYAYASRNPSASTIRNGPAQTDDERLLHFHLDRAAIDLKHNDLKSAESRLEKVRHLLPPHCAQLVQLYTLQTTAFITQSQWSKAEATLEKLIAYDGPTPTRVYRVSVLQCRQDRWDEALATIKEVKEGEMTADIHHYTAELCFTLQLSLDAKRHAAAAVAGHRAGFGHKHALELMVAIAAKAGDGKEQLKWERALDAETERIKLMRWKTAVEDDDMMFVDARTALEHLFLFKPYTKGKRRFWKRGRGGSVDVRE